MNHSQLYCFNLKKKLLAIHQKRVSVRKARLLFNLKNNNNLVKLNYLSYHVITKWICSKVLDNLSVITYHSSCIANNLSFKKN